MEEEPVKSVDSTLIRRLHRLLKSLLLKSQDCKLNCNTHFLFAFYLLDTLSLSKALFLVFDMLLMERCWLYHVILHSITNWIAADKTVSVFETNTFTRKFLLEGHEKGVNYIAWSPDSKYLASCSDDRTVRIWNCENVLFRSSLDRIGVSRAHHYQFCPVSNMRSV